MSIIKLNNLKQFSAEAYKFIQSACKYDQHMLYEHLPEDEFFDMMYIKDTMATVSSYPLVLYRINRATVELWYGEVLENKTYIRCSTGDVVDETGTFLGVRFRS